MGRPLGVEWAQGQVEPSATLFSRSQGAKRESHETFAQMELERVMLAIVGGCGVGDGKQNLGSREPGIKDEHCGPGPWWDSCVLFCAERPLLLLPRSLTPLVPPGGDGELPGHCHGRLPVLPLLGTASHHPEQHGAHPHLREAPL